MANKLYQMTPKEIVNMIKGDDAFIDFFAYKPPTQTTIC